jgi:hypothetical protein
LPFASQTVGATQSFTEVQVRRQVPSSAHLYGEQSCVAPVAPVAVCSPSQVAPDAHFWLATSHVLPGAQSLAAEHVVLHASATHAYAPHEAVAGGTHVPLPSHSAALADVVPVQLAAGPHDPPAGVVRRHAPVPLHWPSAPQSTPEDAHSLSGSVPSLLGPQVPSARLDCFRAAAHA